MHFPEDQSMRVSHETIYRSLSIEARGVLKNAPVRHLRSQRRIRRSRHSGVRGQCRGQIVDAVSIRKDPQKSKTDPFPIIGRAICSAVPTIVTS